MAETLLTGLVGAGIGASLSPLLHEREAQRTGLRLVYQLIDLDKLKLPVRKTPALLAAAAQLGFSGANITHPCKQIAVESVDELSAEAAAIGAVNAVRFAGGRIVGHNTDWLGFARNLDANLAGAAKGCVALIGAGGAGSAVAYALLRLGADEIVVVDAIRARTDALVERMRRQFGPARIHGTDLELLEPAVGQADGLVNATPVGMAANPGSPCPAGLLRPELWVADVVYTPLETALLRSARAAGCRTLGGGGMLVYQAAEAFRLFTGVRPDTGRMLRHFAELTGRDTTDRRERVDERIAAAAAPGAR